MKAELEARNLEAKGEANKVAREDRRPNVVVLRQASETGQLYGSVTARDIVASFEGDGVTVSRSQVAAGRADQDHRQAQGADRACIRKSKSTVTVTVARSADEAERINRGENVLSRRDEAEDAAEAAELAAETFFEKPEQAETIEADADEGAEASKD